MNRYLDWLGQAERDLQKAQVDVDHEFWEWACFTAQQAAEKAVKALLMRRGYAVRGHGITALLQGVPDPPVPEGLIEKAQLLDAYYIPARYPNGFPSGKPADYFNEKKAREAYGAAHEILRFCRDHCA